MSPGSVKPALRFLQLPERVLLQTEALRKERVATEESLQAERAARYAADQEAVELQRKIDELDDSLAQERWGAPSCHTEGLSASCKLRAELLEARLLLQVAGRCHWPGSHHAQGEPARVAGQAAGAGRRGCLPVQGALPPAASQQRLICRHPLAGPLLLAQWQIDWPDER